MRLIYGKRQSVCIIGTPHLCKDYGGGGGGKGGGKGGGRLGGRERLSFQFFLEKEEVSFFSTKKGGVGKIGGITYFHTN